METDEQQLGQKQRYHNGHQSGLSDAPSLVSPSPAWAGGGNQLGGRGTHIGRSFYAKAPFPGVEGVRPTNRERRRSPGIPTNAGVSSLQVTHVTLRDVAPNFSEASRLTLLAPHSRNGDKTLGVRVGSFLGVENGLRTAPTFLGDQLTWN